MFILVAIFAVIIVVMIWTAAIRKKENEIESKQDNTSENHVDYIQDKETGVIIRTDNKPISDEEIPYLIELGYQHALEREKQSSNPIFHRTAKEEDLCVQFMMNHGDEIGKHVSSFEDCYRLASAQKDLNKKIELLQKTIIKYEKAKAWFYRTKGGTIYFQDMYEHLYNSRNHDFSYKDMIEDCMEEYIYERDYLIPEILKIIKSSNGILQKDIYQHLPDISRTDIQRIVRNFESEGLITKEKSKGSYLLTIKETQ